MSLEAPPRTLVAVSAVKCDLPHALPRGTGSSLPALDCVFLHRVCEGAASPREAVPLTRNGIFQCQGLRSVFCLQRDASPPLGEATQHSCTSGRPQAPSEAMEVIGHLPCKGRPAL